MLMSDTQDLFPFQIIDFRSFDQGTSRIIPSFLTGIIEQTNTERLLCDIREYHMKMVEHEARLISLCSDYAALHVLTQVRISRLVRTFAVHSVI